MALADGRRWKRSANGPVGGVTVAVGPIALRAEGVYRNTNDYRVPGSFGEDRVHGSYNETSTVSLGASWIGDGGYLGFAYTRQRSEYGLPGHNHEYESCHPHGSSLHCGSHGEEEGDEHNHGDEHGEVPIVKLRSERFDIRSEYRDPLPGLEKLRFRLSFTDYEHDEIEGEEEPTTFKNKAYDVRLDLTHKPIGGLRGVFGVQHSESRFSATGGEAFLPLSETRNTALYLMETLQTGPIRIELAARQEWQTIDTTLGRRAKHNPFSISGAAVWDIGGDYSLALSLARSQRAPNVQELYARGVHLATNTYELGTAALGKETSRSVDLTFRKTAVRLPSRSAHITRALTTTSSPTRSISSRTSGSSATLASMPPSPALMARCATESLPISPHPSLATTCGPGSRTAAAICLAFRPLAWAAGWMATGGRSRPMSNTTTCSVRTRPPTLRPRHPAIIW